MTLKIGDKVKYVRNIEDPTNVWKIPLEVVGVVIGVQKETPCNILVEYEIVKTESNWFSEEELGLV
jgi:hypothetical protein